jgi:hypothetical protein
VPGREELAAVADRYSPDVAALLFTETVLGQPGNAELQREYDMAIAAPPVEWELDPTLEILFVPGWFYRSHPENGGDFRAQREQLTATGFRTRLAEIDENGTVEDNAAIVADVVRELRVDGRRVIVVSASKSGPEVGLAIGRLLEPAEIAHVLAWVSIGGVVRGSPLADEALEPRLCWLVKSQFAREGFDLEGLESLQTERRRAAAEGMEFPDGLLRLSYVAVPLSGDVGKRARFTYRRMRDDGPNDGLTLLIDELIPGGHVIVELGSDHYFQRPDQPQRTLALLTVVLTRLGFRARDPSTAA